MRKLKPILGAWEHEHNFGTRLLEDLEGRLSLDHADQR